jgi:surface protein
VTPIPAYTSFQDLITQCLIEEYYTGECTAFASATNYGTMPNWDTSLVTDMSGDPNNYGQGFSRGGFNGDISRWNTEKVTDMSYIFRSASAFNQDIGSWNTAQVTTMRAMFYQASAFNQDIGSWNTAEVTNMEYMFGYASAFNHDISSWTGTAATSAQGNMFLDATAFQATFECTDPISGPVQSCVYINK